MRTLLQVRAEDHTEADLMFTTLMGDQVEPRRKFIEDNALDVKNLDSEQGLGTRGSGLDDSASSAVLSPTNPESQSLNPNDTTSLPQHSPSTSKTK